MATRRQQDFEKRRRKAWVPLFGFISLVVFAGFSWVIAPQVRPTVERLGVVFPAEWPVWAGDLLIALVIFVLLFAAAMMLVALLAGAPSDPRDVRSSSKEIRKELQERARRRRRY